MSFNFGELVKKFGDVVAKVEVIEGKAVPIASKAMVVVDEFASRAKALETPTIPGILLLAFQMIEEIQSAHEVHAATANE